MGQVNWLAVILAANLAVAVGIIWYGPLFRTRNTLLRGPGNVSRPLAGGYVPALVVMLMAAWLMGHNFARVGTDTLHAKPWLYWMMSGGFALFITAPALYLGLGRHGISMRERLIDSGFWIAAFLTMGTMFWALG